MKPVLRYTEALYPSLDTFVKEHQICVNFCVVLQSIHQSMVDGLGLNQAKATK